MKEHAHFRLIAYLKTYLNLYTTVPRMIGIVLM